MGLFNIIDNDGKTISANEVPDSSFISIQSKIVTDVDPLILAYLRISARELNNDFVIPSRQSYFSTTTNLFARDLLDFLIPEDTDLLSSRKIRAFSPIDSLETSEEGLTNRITQAVNENDALNKAEMLRQRGRTLRTESVPDGDAPPPLPNSVAPGTGPSLPPVGGTPGTVPLPPITSGSDGASR